MEHSASANGKIQEESVLYYLVITGLALFFPLLAAVLCFIIYGFIKVPQSVKRFVFFVMVLCLSYLGFLYERTDATGDLYRYTLSLDYYAQSIFSGQRQYFIESPYEIFYPSWYFLFYSLTILGLDIRHLNLIALFSVLFSVYYTLRSLSSIVGSPVEKSILMKLALCIPLVPLLASYRTMFAYSLLLIGLIMWMKKKPVGSILILFSVGLHPICLMVLMIYLASRYIKVVPLILVGALFFGYFSAGIIDTVASYSGSSFFQAKVNEYIYGDWSTYRFHERGEYARVVLICVFAVFLLFAYQYRRQWAYKQCGTAPSWLPRYNQFIFLYIAVAFFFISYRTIGMRLLLDSFILFIPLFYQVLSSRFMLKKRVASLTLLLLWLFMIDVRVFNFSNTSFTIGNGFPLVLLDSPILRIINI